MIALLFVLLGVAMVGFGIYLDDGEAILLFSFAALGLALIGCVVLPQEIVEPSSETREAIEKIGVVQDGDSFLYVAQIDGESRVWAEYEVTLNVESVPEDYVIKSCKETKWWVSPWKFESCETELYVSSLSPLDTD